MAHKQPFDENYRQKTISRLHKKLEISSTGCWIWKGGTNGKYGVFYYKRRWTYAHRVSYELYKNEEPRSYYVCHHCDIPLCCNPDHLFLGTNSDNILDLRKKGRGIHGSRCTNSKLKPTDVFEIKKLLQEGVSQQKIAKQFGIAQTTVSGINIGRYWKHLNDHPNK